MALPKENAAVENQSEGFVSKPDESAASAAAQLEPLLDLLVELKIGEFTGEIAAASRAAKLDSKRCSAVSASSKIRGGRSHFTRLALPASRGQPGVEPDRPLLLSRCVLFEPITKKEKSK